VSVLPPLGSIVITSIAAPFADNLIANGVDTTKAKHSLLSGYLKRRPLLQSVKPQL